MQTMPIQFHLSIIFATAAFAEADAQINMFAVNFYILCDSKSRD